MGRDEALPVLVYFFKPDVKVLQGELFLPFRVVSAHVGSGRPRLSNLPPPKGILLQLDC